MQYHKLGASDMNLSALSIGTWAIGGANWGETDRTSSIRAMHAMFGRRFTQRVPSQRQSNFIAILCCGYSTSHHFRKHKLQDDIRKFLGHFIQRLLNLFFGRKVR